MNPQPLDLDAMKWKEPVSEKAKFQNELIDEVKQRVKSAVAGLKKELDGYHNPYGLIKVDVVEKLIDKWFPDVFEEVDRIGGG